VSLSYREVADILKIIDSSQCEELILEMENIRLVVRRGGAQTAEAGAPRPVQTTPASHQAPPPAERPAAMPEPAAETRSAGAAAQVGVAEIRAPMVGTFFRRPSPNEPPFVEEGARIKPGDALGLIEVMKLYTTIEATAAGTVTSILADDGALVEFNQLLLTITPD